MLRARIICWALLLCSLPELFCWCCSFVYCFLQQRPNAASLSEQTLFSKCCCSCSLALDLISSSLPALHFPGFTPVPLSPQPLSVHKVFFVIFLVQPPQHKYLCREASSPCNPITVVIHWSLDKQIRVTWKPVRVPALVTSLYEQWREMLSGKLLYFVPVAFLSGVSGTVKYKQVEERLSGRSLFFHSLDTLSLGHGLYSFLSQNDLSQIGIF